MTLTTPDTVDLGQYIEIRDGRAHIRGRDMPIVYIVTIERTEKRSMRELAYEFTLSEEQVLAALFYYHLHREEMDAEDAAYQEEARRLYAKYGGEFPGKE